VPYIGDEQISSQKCYSTLNTEIPTLTQELKYRQLFMIYKLNHFVFLKTELSIYLIGH